LKGRGFRGGSDEKLRRMWLEREIVVVGLPPLIRQSFEGYRCISAIAICAWRVTWNYVYSPFILQMVLFKNDDDLGVLGFNPGIRSQRRKEVNLSKISILIVIGNYIQGVPRNMTFNKSLFLVKKSFASLSFTLKSSLI